MKKNKTNLWFIVMYVNEKKNHKPLNHQKKTKKKRRKLKLKTF